MAKNLGFQPSVIYQDPRPATRWLEDAFGFEAAIDIEGDDGGFIHCQMRYGDAAISVGQEWSAQLKRPLKLGGRNTQLNAMEAIAADEALQRVGGGMKIMGWV